VRPPGVPADEDLRHGQLDDLVVETGGLRRDRFQEGAVAKRAVGKPRHRQGCLKDVFLVQSQLRMLPGTTPCHAYRIVLGIPFEFPVSAVEQVQSQSIRQAYEVDQAPQPFSRRASALSSV
jgi:hypothetical protein